jgi:hypothetical protein
MRVGETMTFQQYWDDPRFEQKRPLMRGSKKQSFGDNIYHRVGQRWRQEDSHHSLADGSPNIRNIENDTRTDRVLVSDDFVYFGGAGPIVPSRFRNADGFNICTGRRGHTNSYPTKMVNDFIAWLRSLGETGYCGEPLDWAKTP